MSDLSGEKDREGIEQLRKEAKDLVARAELSHRERESMEELLITFDEMLDMALTGKVLVDSEKAKQFISGAINFKKKCRVIRDDILSLRSVFVELTPS